MINLNNITIILKGTYYDGNIGSAARAMNNMGLKKMILVNPRCTTMTEAYSMARSASKIFENAPVFGTLAEAVKDFDLVLGTSRRGAYRLHMRTSPRIMADEIAQKYNHVKTAIVFGDEKAGLSNEDLKLCSWYVKIPSHPSFESLNMSQSVMVICYELYLGSLKEPDELLKEAATYTNIQNLMLHVEQYLKSVGFPDRGSPHRVFTDIRRVISSADLKRTDVNLAHGFLRFMEQKFYGHRLQDFETFKPPEEL